MFLPFETSCTQSFYAVVRYEWVPVARPEATGCEAGASAAANGFDTRMHLQAVLAGVDWVACPVWRAQANPAWDQCVRNERQEAEEHARQRAREAHREPLPTDAAPEGAHPPPPAARTDATPEADGTRSRP